MAEQYECKEIKEVQGPGGQRLLQLSHKKPNGEMIHHIEPWHVLEARAIEYEMDLDRDLDAILDIVVHEPFIDDAQNGDPAEEEGYVTEVQGRMVSANLFTAETIQDAREAHLLRIERTKQRGTAVSIPKELRQSLRTKVMKPAVRGFLATTQEPSHPVLKDLAEEVARQRRAIRGRGDGSPLKARIERTKEGT